MSEPNPLQLCPACGGANHCALSAGREAQSCWCWRIETRLPIPTDSRACFCQRCLQRLTRDAMGDTSHEG